MTSNHHGLYALGDTRATMAGTEGREAARWSQSQKAGLSSDWSLQPDSMKVESLVIAHQPWRGEIRSRTLYTPPVKPWKPGVPEDGDFTGSCLG